jgi:hypothetical protein
MTAAPDTSADLGPLLYEQVSLLSRLAEMGMGIAGVIERQVIAADAAGETVAERAPIDFARVARAVRLTLMLQARLIKDLEDRERGVAQRRAWDRNDLAKARKTHVEHVVERIVARQHTDTETVERLIWETSERLDREDLYGHVLDRPLSELIDMLCADMGLDPDWPRLAQEAWAREEMAGGVVGWPLTESASPSTKSRFKVHASSP